VPLNSDVRQQTVMSREFQFGMDTLIESWCASRSLGPLRIVLPHWPMPNGFSDELVALTRALRTVRIQHRASLSAVDFERIVSLQHIAESALEGNA
jgi:hypothetical protein